MARGARLCTVGCFSAAVLGPPSEAFAQTPPAPVAISVDATSAGPPINRVWAFHGFDEVNFATTTAGKNLLETLGTIHTTPPHIRNHFLLNSGDGTPSFKWGSTNVYSADATGNPVYDWTIMDGIMDAITSAGAFPLVEIGFMPHDLSTHPDPYQNSGIYLLDGGCFYPPTDYTKWAALVSAWAMHSDARYPSVSSQWQWELWNEPDGSYWHGTPEEYDTLFDYTESALHQALPNASLGGPAVATPGAFLTQFLQHAATGTNAVSGATGTRLDMISFHAKGGVGTVGDHVEMSLGHQLVLHRQGFEAVAAFPQFQQTPIVVSEADPDGCAACPLSQNPADAYRLSPAYGAYEIAMMKRTMELADRIGVNIRGLLTWAFLFSDQPYFAGYRVLSSNDIHLPVLGAFELLGRLQGARLPLTSSGALSLDTLLAASVRDQPDVDGIATLDDRSVQVLVWNYHDDLVAAPVSTVSLTVKLPSSFGTRALVDELRVDDSHGDAYAVWTSQGSPAAPTPAQLAQLRQGMDPAAIQSAQSVDVTGGAVHLNLELPRFGVSLVTLSAATPSDGGSGASTSGMGSLGSVEGGGKARGCACATGGTTGSSPSAWPAVALGLVSLAQRRRRGCASRTERAARQRATHAHI